MTEWVPITDREEFKDLQPLPEYSEDILVGRISYSPMFNNEISLRALTLTNEAIQVCPGYYSAWRLRRELVEKLAVDLNQEIEFLNEVSLKTPKNYQIWSYRREILTMRGKPEGEIEFLRKIFDIDKKNIHAWGYRQWLVKKFGLWAEDRQYALELIREDSFNNSAWNQLIFVSKNDGTLEALDRKLEETELVLQFCIEKENECPFNYLRGLYCTENQRMIKEKFVFIAREVGIFTNLLKTLADFYQVDGNKDMQDVCYEKLQDFDVVRQLFWKWKKENSKGESSGDEFDEEILKILKSV